MINGHLLRSCFEKMEQQWCKVIIKELLAYIGAGDMNDSQTALKILSQIADQHVEKIRPLAALLRVRGHPPLQNLGICYNLINILVQVLLNKLIDLPLTDVAQLMDILCGIAFADTEEGMDTSCLRDDITMLIETNIMSSNLKLSRPGIVSAVMAIKYIAMQPDEETNIWPDKASDDFDEHQLTDRAKRALPFLSKYSVGVVFKTDWFCRELIGLVIV